MIINLLSPALVRGAAELERTERGLRPHRLPRLVRERLADPHLAAMEAQPSGVRISVTTAARSLALDLHATRMAYRGLPRARGAVDVVVDGLVERSCPLTDGDLIELDAQTGTSTLSPGGPDHLAVTDLPAGEKEIELWLPHNEQVDLIALRSEAPVRPTGQTGPVWLHHGSSISQGSNTASPTGTWPAVAARRVGAQLYNVAFGGSAMVDQFTARVMRDAPADVISVKLGINVVNADAMRLRAFVPAVHGFIDTLRDGHPETPLLLISPIHCEIHEDTPGPAAFDPGSLDAGAARFIATGTRGDTTGGRLTLQVIRRALADIARGRTDDPHLHHLDGRTLYDATDAAQHPLPDALHPDPATHTLMGERFADLAFGPGGAFRPPPARLAERGGHPTRAGRA